MSFVVRACEMNGFHSNVREAARQQSLRAAIEPGIAQYDPVRVTCELLEMACKQRILFPDICQHIGSRIAEEERYELLCAKRLVPLFRELICPPTKGLGDICKDAPLKFTV